MSRRKAPVVAFRNPNAPAPKPVFHPFMPPARLKESEYVSPVSPGERYEASYRALEQKIRRIVEIDHDFGLTQLHHNVDALLGIYERKAAGRAAREDYE